MPVEIAIFARAPVAGEAKTRLIPRLGAEGAAALQHALIHRALQTAVAANAGPGVAVVRAGLRASHLRQLLGAVSASRSIRNMAPISARGCSTPLPDFAAEARRW